MEFGTTAGWKATELSINEGFKQLFKPVLNTFGAITQLGNATHVLKIDDLPVVNNTMQTLVEAIGLHPQMIKCLLMFLIAYPFSFVLRLIPFKNLKHLVSAAGGFFLLQWLFQEDWIHAFVTSIVTYLICLIIPSKWCAVTTFLFSMTYLTISHIVNYTGNYLDLVNPVDFTGTQMVLTMKLTSFAYNIFDGSQREVEKLNAAELAREAAKKELDAAEQEPTDTIFDPSDLQKRAKIDKILKAKDRAERDVELFKERKEFALTSLPNPLEYLGYMWCFPCLLGGPAFEFKDYMDGITNENRPSSFLPAMKLLLVSFVCLGLRQVISGYIGDDVYFNPTYLVPGANLAIYFLKCCANLLSKRFNYYFVWKISEGACILAGFGYNEKTKEWDGVENVEILGYELAPTTSFLTKAWNKRTQKWLEKYTYKRCSNQSIREPFTYFISAFWHGLYPGYYFFFLTIAVYTALFEKIVFIKYFPEQFKQMKEDIKSGKFSLFRCFTWLTTHIFLNFCGCAFMAKTLSQAMTCWNYLKFYPLIALLILAILVKVIPGRKKGKDKKIE